MTGGCSDRPVPTPADLVDAMVLAAGLLPDAVVERLAVVYGAELQRRREATDRRDMHS